MSRLKKIYIEKHLSDTVELKVFMKSIKYGDENYAIKISIEQKLVFESCYGLEALNQIDKNEIISKINRQLYRDNKVGNFDDWEIVQVKQEPIIYWNWVLPLTLIPIILYSALPSYFTGSEIPPISAFNVLLPYGFYSFIAHLWYYAFFYFLLYGLWAYKFKYEVRVERAINRIVLISIIAMTYSVFVDFSGRQPTQLEKLTTLRPYIFLEDLG